MAGTQITLPITTDSWSLARLREAAQYRAENPGDPAEDAYLDAHLAECESAAAEVGTTYEPPVADEPTPARRNTSGASNYSAPANGPTDKQLAFIASLLAERPGLDPAKYQPRSKSHASLLIDQLKKLPRGGSVATPATPAQRPARPATQRQVEFLSDLWNEREHVMGETVPDDMTVEDASALIEFLKDQPRAATQGAHGIRAGRYAHRDEAEAGVVHFYRVARNGDIKVIAGPAEHPYNGKLNASLEWIKANPREAAALYGQQIGNCGRCGLRLSDKHSREVGLGPVCEGKSEW